MGDGGELAAVNALLQGADSYIKKPLNYTELLSRIRGLMRRIDLDLTAIRRKSQHTL